VDRPQGTILRTPLAYALGAFPSARDARKAAEGLRERGIPAYIVPEADGTARMLLGAFEVPEQAHTADSLLTALGVRGVLITRIGTPE
jgi:cell division septation protein DedD